MAKIMLKSYEKWNETQTGGIRTSFVFANEEINHKSNLLELSMNNILLI